jgi:hypothetical protein
MSLNQYKLQKYLRKYKETNKMKYLDKVMYYLKVGGGNGLKSCKSVINKFNIGNLVEGEVYKYMDYSVDLQDLDYNDTYALVKYVGKQQNVYEFVLIRDLNKTRKFTGIQNNNFTIKEITDDMHFCLVPDTNVLKMECKFINKLQDVISRKHNCIHNDCLLRNNNCLNIPK